MKLNKRLYLGTTHWYMYVYDFIMYEFKLFDKLKIYSSSSI